jgi:hypothetical protein
MATDINAPEHGVSSAPTLGVRPHLWALFGYFLLALVVTYPLILHFTAAVPGELIADRDQHLWDIWWIGDALSRFTSPFHTDMLYYPYGVDLYYHALGLSHGLIGVVPLALLGLPAAYNTVVLAAFILSGYGAFRLCLLITKHSAAAFLGGVVFAFMPYTLDALKGQTEVLSVQWMPFYAEAWIRAWRGGKLSHMVAAGLFLALAAYGSLYYAVYLLLFTAAYILYSLFASSDRAGVLKGAWRPTVLVGSVTLALTLPLIIGLVKDYNNPLLEVPAEEGHILSHSADLLTLFSPSPNHPLLSDPKAQGTHSSDDIAMGYFAFALAVIGATTAWRKKGTRFWVALGVVALVLSLGPQLQVGSTVTGVPMPFALLEGLPGISAIGKVSRFLVLTRLCMAVLAAWGAVWALTKLQKQISRDTTSLASEEVDISKSKRVRLSLINSKLKQALLTGTLLALLLVELPIRPRYIEPLNIPAGFQALGSHNTQYAIRNTQYALMDLPFATRQAETMGRRMLFQTAHRLPIMGGYLSRTYNSPIIDQCSPFWGFISASATLYRSDIAAPTVESRPLDVLRFYNIGYLALYSTYGGPDDAQLKPDEEEAFLDIVGRVSGGKTLYEDSYVRLYEVDQSRAVAPVPSYHIGNGWHDVEMSGGVPFRWMAGNEAALCVFTPQPIQAALTMEANSFGQERDTRLWIGSREVYSGKIASGVITPIRTGIIEWPAGMTQVRVTAGGPGITPQSLDSNNTDKRTLTMGVKALKLEVTSQK